MDATVIKEESLTEIARAVGKGAEIDKLTEAAMTGAMDFQTSLITRLKILEGIPRQVILQSKPTIQPGMLELAKFAVENHIKLFLVSGGFDLIAEPLARRLQFTDWAANRFKWHEDHLIPELDGPCIDANAKASWLKNWSHQFGFDQEEVWAIGDGANDALMMKHAAVAVGFDPKKILWPHLDFANHSGSHRLMHELLKCLQATKNLSLS
jgi:phosphoserine phosphatase